MKKLWARVGMEIEVSDGLYNILVNDMNNNPAKESTRQLIKSLLEERGKLSGETYFPAEIDEWNKGIKDDYDLLF